MIGRHEVTRVRQEPQRRRVSVRAVERLTPNMVRVTFAGESLAGFSSLGFDDHVKLFFSTADGAPAARDFTPRAYDEAARELVIDFALHATGPASDWAGGACPGQVLEIGGPRSSSVIPDDFDGYLFVGDETALPAIARRLEQLRADAPVVVVAAVTGPKEELVLASAAGLDVHWVHRGQTQRADAAGLLAALAAVRLPPGDIHAWVAGESGVAKAVRHHLITDLQLRADWVKAAGYWRQGGAGVHEPLRD